MLAEGRRSALNIHGDACAAAQHAHQLPQANGSV
jgi:hypothetical protein